MALFNLHMVRAGHRLEGGKGGILPLPPIPSKSAHTHTFSLAPLHNHFAMPTYQAVSSLFNITDIHVLDFPNLEQNGCVNIKQGVILC